MKQFLVIIVIALLVSCTQCHSKIEDIKKKVSKYAYRTQHCSREHSKFVREYFARELLPIYQQLSLPVPEKCPFSPVYDMYHFQENNKTKLEPNRWKCEICGKLFISEKHLDNHFENRHNNSLQTGANTVCLADHCKLFRCDYLMNPNTPPKKCYESYMINIRNKCKNLLDLCVPQSATHSAKNQLIVDLRNNLCAYLTCSKINELPKYMTKGPSFLTIFLIVICIGLCIITYGVLNHTDLIFDEREISQYSDIDFINNAQNEENKMRKINNIKKSGILGSLLNRKSNTPSSNNNSNVNNSNQNARKQDQNIRQKGFFDTNNDTNNNFLRQRQRFNNL